MSCCSNRDSAIDEGLELAKNALKTAGPAASNIPGLGAALVALEVIIDKVKQTRDNDAAVKGLSEQIGALTRILETAISKTLRRIEADVISSNSLSSAFDAARDYQSLVEELQGSLDGLAEKAKTLRKGTFLTRCLHSSRNRDVLKELTDGIADAVRKYGLQGQMSIQRSIIAILDGLPAIAAGLEEVRQDVAAVAQKQDTNLDDKTLQSLPCADAGYRSAIHAMKSQFLEGTRVRLFEELDSWAKGRGSKYHSKRVYVLSGGAGTGKSTIASEFAKRVDDAGRLGASFLFVRNVEDLSSTRLLFSTIARQLADSQDTLRPYIVNAAREHLKAGRSQQLQYELENLFQTPLSRVPEGHPPVVIVIDALDECTDQNSHVVTDMLRMLLRSLRAIRFDVRIFLTTRPEENVEAALQEEEFSDLVFIQSLHDLPRGWVDADIRRFFDVRINQIPSKDTLLEAYPDAAGDLTRLADGLFVYARTAIDFIGGFPSGPEDRLRTLLSGSGSGLGPLDALYMAVLTNAFPSDKYKDYPQGRDIVQAILQSIALLRDHVSLKALCGLVHIKPDDLGRYLNSLRSLVLFDNEDVDSKLQPLHATFPQFLVDKERCTDAMYQVVPKKHQRALAIGCLETLLGTRRKHRGITRNMCALPDPWVPKADIPDLAERVRDCIPPDMQYASVHWAAHLAATPKNGETYALLQNFASSKMVVWLEILSFMGRLDVAADALSLAKDWYADPGPTYDLLEKGSRLAKDRFAEIDACPEFLYTADAGLVAGNGRAAWSGDTSVVPLADGRRVRMGLRA